MNFPVFDLHCDTAYEMVRQGKNLLSNDLHIDLTRGSVFPGYAQCFACFSTSGYDWMPDPEGLFRRETDNIKRQIAENQDTIRIATNAKQIRENQEAGLISAILTAEGSAGIDFDITKLEDLKQEGFVMISPCWNEQNILTGSHITGGGLTEQGRAFIRKAQELGFIIDVSHISDQAFWDIMDMTTMPIVATHSDSRAICNHSRNITDEMFRMICQVDGVAGINLYTQFLGGKSLDAVCDHIFHYLSLDPDGTHIALGGDLDGCDSIPNEIQGVQDYPKLGQRLMERGLSETTVHNIFWNNALGVIERCCT